MSSTIEAHRYMRPTVYPCCPGARTFGITVVSCVRCGALLPKNR